MSQPASSVDDEVTVKLAPGEVTPAVQLAGSSPDWVHSTRVDVEVMSVSN